MLRCMKKKQSVSKYISNQRVWLKTYNNDITKLCRKYELKLNTIKLSIINLYLLDYISKIKST